MTETKAERKRRYKRVAIAKTKAEAQAKAARLRAQGHKCRVRRDPSTGNWIVEVFTLVVAFTLLGALLGVKK